MSNPEDQPPGKAEGKPPARRLWNVERQPKVGDFRRACLMATMRTIFKANVPKLSGPKRPFFLISVLFRLNKKSKTMLEDVLEWAWPSHHMQSTVNLTHC